jgi:hypothetical protein
MEDDQEATTDQRDTLALTHTTTDDHATDSSGASFEISLSTFSFLFSLVSLLVLPPALSV